MYPDLNNTDIESRTEHVGYMPQGSIVPMITPGIEYGLTHTIEIDHESTGRLIERLIAGGSSGLFILGTTGEFRTLSTDRKLDVILSAAEYTQGRVPILVGVSADTLDETAKLIEYAVRINGVGALVIAPNYGTGEPDDKVKLVAESGLPFAIYNNPGITEKRSVTPDEIIRWRANFPNLVAVKDTSTKDGFVDMLRVQGYGIAVLQGSTTNVQWGLHLGADGIVCNLANLKPEVFTQLYVTRNDIDVNDYWIYGVERWIESMKTEGLYNLPGIKHSLVQMGIIRSDALF